MDILNEVELIIVSIITRNLPVRGTGRAERAIDIRRGLWFIGGAFLSEKCVTYFIPILIRQNNSM
jgi:hypothetical protein